MKRAVYLIISGVRIKYLKSEFKLNKFSTIFKKLKNENK